MTLTLTVRVRVTNIVIRNYEWCSDDFTWMLGDLELDFRVVERTMKQFMQLYM